MKKQIIILSVLSCLFYSCNQLNTNLSLSKNYSEDESQILKKCYSKSSSSNFISFLKNDPDKKVEAYRSALLNNESNSSDANYFEQIWESLSDEEKVQITDNMDELTVTFDNYIGIEKESEIGRAVIEGDTYELDKISLIYGLYFKLMDNFENQYISPDIIMLDKKKVGNEKIPVVQAIEFCMQNDMWECIDSILKEVNSKITVRELKKEYEMINSYTQKTEINRAASVVGYQETPLFNNFGLTLPNGAVLLTCPKDKAFVIAGQWQHAGIFSKSKYKSDLLDASLCVYTAQPDNYHGFPDYLKPDRPGYACLDTICMYTYQKRVASLIPKNYSSYKAERAVNDAERIFYNTKPEYNLPMNEFFFIGDTSHDGTNKNTYCSKVVYTSWYNAGENLDAGTFAGNLVSPDDIFDSTIDTLL